MLLRVEGQSSEVLTGLGKMEVISDVYKREQDSKWMGGKEVKGVHR